MLGPLLYLLYTVDSPLIFSKHFATSHLFADDIQAFVYDSPAQQFFLTGLTDALFQDLHPWMSSNRLSLNSSKTQLIWFGICQLILKLDLTLLSVKFSAFTFPSMFGIWVSFSIAPSCSPTHFQSHPFLLLVTSTGGGSSLLDGQFPLWFSHPSFMPLSALILITATLCL